MTRLFYVVYSDCNGENQDAFVYAANFQDALNRYYDGHGKDIGLVPGETVHVCSVPTDVTTPGIVDWGHVHSMWIEVVSDDQAD